MNVEEKLALAIKNHQTGNLPQAEILYKEILTAWPNNFYVLHYLGILYYQLRNYASAIEYIKEALRVNPSASDAYYNLGNVYKDSKKFHEAIDCYEKALEFNPSNADAHNNEGIIYKDKKQLEKAVTHFKKAVELNPEHLTAYYNLGIVYNEKGELDNAVECFRKVLDLNPNSAGAYYNLGKSFHEKGRLDDAVSHYRKAIQLNPDIADLYCNLGTVLQEKGELDDAIASYHKAIELDPNIAETYCNLANALKRKNEIDDAIVYYRKAIRLNPSFADAFNNLGVSLRDKGRFSEAIDSYYTALRLKPHSVETYSNLGNVYKDLGDLDKAENFYKDGLIIKPDCSFCYSNLLLLMNYSNRYDAQDIFLETIQFSKQIIEPMPLNIHSHANECLSMRRLRIGYVSSDFRKHSVAHFIVPVLMSHNVEQYKIFCFSCSVLQDEVTKRIQRHVDRWQSIVGLSDEDAAALILKNRIDILIDLNGHTSDNRLLLFARRPAPVQVSWIGYPATTGLSAMDYKIVDRYTDPPGMTEQFYTEKLIRMPESFLCYLPDSESPEVGNVPALASGQVTFGSFNNFTKVSLDVMEMWAKILKEVPGSCLIMKAKSLSDKSTRRYVADLFAERGVTAEQLDLLPWELSTQRHLSTYNRIDIGLDTYPYNGTTTTCEALWMGVPVVTLVGKTHASRVGLSLLSNIGLDKLIAKTPDEYIYIAVTLAGNLSELRDLRENLRSMMMRSSLMNAERFVGNLENCYRGMWKEWCNRGSQTFGFP